MLNDLISPFGVNTEVTAILIMLCYFIQGVKTLCCLPWCNKGYRHIHTHYQRPESFSQASHCFQSFPHLSKEIYNYLPDFFYAVVKNILFYSTATSIRKHAWKIIGGKTTTIRTLLEGRRHPSGEEVSIEAQLLYCYDIHQNNRGQHQGMLYLWERYHATLTGTEHHQIPRLVFH